LRASVEKVKPTARLASMNTPIIAPAAKLPSMGTSNSAAGRQDHASCM
jgi:hypothetical protein